MREVLFSAGETSGDLNAAPVAAMLARLRPDLHLVGLGGSRMREAGVELIEDTVSRAVMGFAEIVRYLPQHLVRLRRLDSRLATGRVALVVCVDYGGFNLRLASLAAKRRVPVLYFITPQVWASRAGRMRSMARTVTKAAVILPFEEKLLRDNGIDATFVGHPMLDRAKDLPDRATARATLGLDVRAPVLALFPGSRAQEVEHLLDPFVGAAREAQRRIPGLQVIVSHAPNVTIDPARCPYAVVRAPSMTVLRAATAVLCKSGTTTLEAAVTGCPLVIAYRTSALTYQIARRLVTIPYIGMVNVVAGRGIAPEFIQNAVRPAAMGDALVPLLEEGSAVRATEVAELAKVRAALGTPGAAERVAEMASRLAG
ncbi:MAG TPA: lipid-A-disaccharide synthase [Gemmatimonadaceae bacterium]|nr:lipid-A-disaccharide synthase [Gemmatimonadaceae bacterium]